MAFNVTALAAYTKTNENMLLHRSFFEPKTASRMQILTGVKSTIQVPALSDTLIWQNGDACGFSASGDTTISARVLTVGRIKVNKEWCVNDLETKYTQLLLSPGSNYDALPGGIDAAFVETILGTTKENVETAIWQGDTNSWNSQLKQFDGLVKIIVIEKSVMFDEVQMTVRVSVKHPVFGEWLDYDGVASTEILPLKKAVIKSNKVSISEPQSLKLALPLVKALAIKNAVKLIGRAFGSDLMRHRELNRPLINEDQLSGEVDLNINTSLLEEKVASFKAHKEGKK